MTMVQERIMLGEERAQMLKMLDERDRRLEQLLVHRRGLAKYTEGLGADLIISTVLATIVVVAGGLYYLGYF